jgi:pimeloyl-ACP methyl ester carboxylesterase
MRHSFCAALAVWLCACGDDASAPDSGARDGGAGTDAGPLPDGQVAPDAGLDPRVMACREAIATKETALAAMLPGWPVDDAPEMVDDGTGDVAAATFAGHYRDDLANHPGCVPQAAYGANSEFLVADNEATVPAGVPAVIPGYDCAAKAYDQTAEDPTKPIVILVHGNSSGVGSFEEYDVASRRGANISSSGGTSFAVDATAREQLVTRLLAGGYRVISFDARTDLVNTQTGHSDDMATGNPFRNIDHGWAVPMLEALIKAVMTENAGRRVSIVGHSLGTTVIRDALRRLYVESRDGGAGTVNPYARLADVVMLSGANHGVTSGETLCDGFAENMRGTVGCEMGDRDAFVPTYFSRRINGPEDLFATPCADGDYAFGMRGQCEGNVVEYTTVTMQDLPGGTLQDEFISEASSLIDLEPCVENELITLADYDTSGYFFSAAPGFFANHFGSPRSNAGIDLVLSKLAD